MRSWLAACVVLAACGDDALTVYQPARVSPRMARVATPFVDDELSVVARVAPDASQSRARKFWIPIGDQLVAGWVVEAYVGDDLLRILVSSDGRELGRQSLRADEAFTYRVWADATGEFHPADGPTADFVPHPTGTPDGSYPPYVASKLITVDSLVSTGDPWLPAGATSTAGNNVDAYTDPNNANSVDGTGAFRATVTSANTFDRVYDLTKPPLSSTQQQMAAITSLFFTINWLHDFWYDAGFTEAAGNAQLVNYGRGGEEGDVLLAEADDAAIVGSRNNANMQTPDDGMSPRMQVYVWSGDDDRSLTLSPSGTSPEIGLSLYGPTSYDVSGPLVLGVPNDGCAALTNTVTGAIVLVDRGNCTFKTKTTNAQAAGALAVIIADNVVEDAPPILGEDPNLGPPTIPTVSVTNADGATIKSELASGPVTATLHRSVDADLDGSLDATLVAHEFGHYIHHRLSVCNNTMCRAMSEGWGDFVALMLTSRDGDDLHGVFPLGIYSTQGSTNDPAYFGIRRVPYSIDPARNALRFHHMSAGAELPTTHPVSPNGSPNNEVHNAGEVWASTLWDVYVALQESGVARGRSFDETRAQMAHYVVRGLQLTPVEATPLETRDALLAAALETDVTDYQTMVQAFAGRGFGSCAIAPPADSVDFTGIVDSSDISGKAELATADIDDACDSDGILDSGETAHIRLHVVNQGHAALTDVMLTVTSAVAGLEILSGPVQRARLEPFENIDLEVDVSLAGGMTDAIADGLSLKVDATGACAPTVELPITTRLNVDDVANASATDTFDALTSVWEPWSAAWHHERPTPLTGIWHADDLASYSDTRLTSPALDVSDDKPLTITIRHRWTFEFSDGTAYDGGVIEYSTDNGTTWIDISTLADAGYTGTITSASGNTLGDRPGFVAQNMLSPAYETTTISLGDALAGQTIRIRFRLGTDAASGADGWDIDEVSFSGIKGKPFPAQVADGGTCTPNDPIVSGGGGCSTSSGASPWLLAIALLWLRRRQQQSVVS